MLSSQDFYKGAKIRLTKVYDGEFPEMDWLTASGCPPLPAGTEGVVMETMDHGILVRFVNPWTSSYCLVSIYNVDVTWSNRTKNRLDCVEFIKEEQVAA